MEAYYFFKVQELSFFDDEKQFKKSQQLSIPATKVNPTPQTYIKLDCENYYKNLARYSCCHEHIENKPRRMAGDPEYIPNSIVGGDKEFFAYHDKIKNIIIFNTSKSTAKGLIRVLHKEFPKSFKLCPIEANFSNIIKKSKDMIIGTWFNNMNGKVKSVGLFGDRVNLDENFDRYNAIASMSVLYLDITLEGSKKALNVAITKEGGVLLYINKNWNISDQLDFLLDYIAPLSFAEIYSINENKK